MTRRSRIGLFLLALILLIAGGAWSYYRSTFPYGWSHSCDLILMNALNQYAEDNGGFYPAGEATPEASLSLLYPKYADEYVLQGKTVPLSVVKETLEKGERLGPDSSGWHYVEGLRSDDDPRLGVCWDKVGLGHNGQRLSDGGRFVLLIKMGRTYIEGSRWQEFLQEQETLLKETAAKRAKK